MENLESLLNSEQLEAVKCTEGPLLVLAGAGSGKTRVLTYRIAYLIENCHVNPWNILAITFTNKAAAEMRERVENLVSSEEGEVWVSTFHSMCVRILRRFIHTIGYSNDFSIYDTDDQRTLMKQIMKRLEVDPRLVRDRAVLSLISKKKNDGVTAEENLKNTAGSDSLVERKTAKLYVEYEKALRQNNALDFDDLLLKTVELLKSNSAALAYYQDRFRYVLVDEYQDTNQIQFQLIDLLSGKYRNIFVVGDDDQSIYKFRGADIHNILSFEEVYKDARVIRLEENYRSTSPILDAANAVISHNHERKGKTLWTRKKGGVPVVFREYENAEEEAREVVSEIRASERPYRDQAVLYRTNAQSRLLEEQCIRQNVPYQIIGGQNFYQRREIKDILAYMKVISNDQDSIAFERIINVPKRGIGNVSLEKLRAFAAVSSEGGVPLTEYGACRQCASAGISGKAVKSIQSFVDFVEGWRNKLAKSGLLGEENTFSGGQDDLAALITSIRDDTGYGEELKAEGEIESASRFENIEELISKAISYQQEEEHPSLAAFLAEVSLLSDLDRKDDDGNLVTLMTLHGAKGLEFPKVFLVGMSEGLFPSFRSVSEEDELEEERRLCYVGITRAREELVMTSARFRMMNGEPAVLPPSRFISEIPDDKIKKELLPGRSASQAQADSDRSSGYGAGFDTGRLSMYNRKFREDLDESGDSDRYSGVSRTTSEPNSFGLYGMGSSGYSGISRKKAKKPSGIPLSYRKGSEISSDHLEYEAGDRVSHVKFGEGTVTDIQKGERDFLVSVNFDRVGVRKMYAGYARLKKLLN